MTKIMIVLMAAMSLVGCMKDPVAVSSTNNPDMVVGKLFTNGNCTIYRFNDGGYLHYYAECGKESTSTSSYYNCGKGCTKSEEIPTGVNYEQH